MKTQTSLKNADYILGTFVHSPYYRHTLRSRCSCASVVSRWSVPTPTSDDHWFSGPSMKTLEPRLNEVARTAVRLDEETGCPAHLMIAQ